MENARVHGSAQELESALTRVAEQDEEVQHLKQMLASTALELQSANDENFKVNAESNANVRLFQEELNSGNVELSQLKAELEASKASATAAVAQPKAEGPENDP